MKNLLILFLSVVITPSVAQLDSLNAYYTKGIEASKSGDSLTYFQYFNLANQIRPNHPTILYHLANSSLKKGDDLSCLEALINMVKNNASIDFDEEAYSQFKGLAGFDQLENLKNQLTKEINQTQVKFKSDLNDHIESMSFNEKNESYYFGSVNSRSIWEITKEGEKNVLISTKQNNAIYAVMGIAIDDKNQILWACTAALPQMEGYSDELEGHSSIVQFNLKSKRVAEVFKFTNGNTFGDIKLKNGVPYISDGSDNNIYYLEGDSFEKFLPENNGFINLQGIDFGVDRIYASDYIRGLYQIDIKTKEIEKLNVFKGYPERGIDGVYYSNQHLYLTQNGTQPMRVLDLSIGKNNKMTINVLIQNDSQLGEPTQGTIVNGKLQFIANSSWANYDKENAFLGNKTGVVVLGN